jgi:hypothetical protein
MMKPQGMKRPVLAACTINAMSRMAMMIPVCKFGSGCGETRRREQELMGLQLPERRKG